MPWVTINLLEGHSDAKKAKLHRAVAKAIVDTLEIPPEWVRIQLVEMKEKDHSIGGTPIDEEEK